MIAVFDNFIQDEKLLAEIEQNKASIFKDPGVYKYYEGWWNSPEDNTTKKIIEYSKLKCKIREVSSSFFKSTVKRPKYSITSKDKIISNFGLNISSWEDSLKTYLNSLKL